MFCIEEKKFRKMSFNFFMYGWVKCFQINSFFSNLRKMISFQKLRKISFKIFLQLQNTTFFFEKINFKLILKKYFSSSISFFIFLPPVLIPTSCQNLPPSSPLPKKKYFNSKFLYFYSISSLLSTLPHRANPTPKLK